MFTIARNVAIDFYKQRKSHVSINEVDAITHPRVQESIEAREELVAMISKLSRAERDLLESRLLNDDEFEQIAAAMKTTPTNVRQKLSRILKKLRAGG